MSPETIEGLGLAASPVVYAKSLACCSLPNCDSLGMERTKENGKAICFACGNHIREAVLGKPWVKPKGFRLSRKPSTVERVYLRGGPYNGQPRTRGSKLSGEKGKGNRMITWKPGFLLPGPPGVCGVYAYDTSIDAYSWVTPEDWS